MSLYSHATAIGAKVRIPVTTVLETDPCLFTNYSGVGPRPQDCGILRLELVPIAISNGRVDYRVIRAQDVWRRLRLWKM